MLSVTCLPQRWSGMCSEVSVSGGDWCDCPGVYKLTYIISERRPVYINAATDRIMSYFNAKWVSKSFKSLANTVIFITQNRI